MPLTYSYMSNLALEFFFGPQVPDVYCHNSFMTLSSHTCKDGQASVKTPLRWSTTWIAPVGPSVQVIDGRVMNMLHH